MFIPAFISHFPAAWLSLNQEYDSVTLQNREIFQIQSSPKCGGPMHPRMWLRPLCDKISLLKIRAAQNRIRYWTRTQKNTYLHFPFSPKIIINVPLQWKCQLYSPFRSHLFKFKCTDSLGSETVNTKEIYFFFFTDEGHIIQSWLCPAGLPKIQ